MKILFDNVNTSSSSGPNSFGKRLIAELQKCGHEAGTEIVNPDVQLSFIMASQKKAKLALRLDGIYFNNKQDWQRLNTPIKASYNIADLVIHQSNFNKKLTEKYFGVSKNSIVINNGTCLASINAIQPLRHVQLDNFSEVWSCSSSWRPHKRLKDNIFYFLEKSPSESCLIVAGENPDYVIQHPRIFYAGHLSWSDCISLYKRSKTFIHLAFLDHCPNVVVDARSAGCNIVVASSGGTKEIAGHDATIVKDIEWDMSPLDLYSPPALNYSEVIKNSFYSNVDIIDVTKRYVEALESL